MDKETLISAIDRILDGGYKKHKKSQMIELYHLAFPHSGLDTNCPGCTIQVWGKLELLKKENYLSLKIKSEIMDTVNKKPQSRFQFKNLTDSETKSYPKLRLYEISNENLTDEIARKIQRAGFEGDLIQKKTESVEKSSRTTKPPTTQNTP